MSIAESKQVWVIGFPKSGNTWISYLCAYCFNLPFINFGNPEEKPTKSWVHQLTNGTNKWPGLKGYDSVQKTHKQPDRVPFRDGLVIYAIRDPRDVFVSYHYFMRSSNARFRGRLRYYLLGFFGKRRQIKWFLSKWDQHVRSWTPHSQMIISYDKLLSDGSDYLAKHLANNPFLIDRTLTDQAYEHFSFEKMSGGRKAGSEDKGSFFRKGVSGDWQNHFSKGEVELFKNSVELYQSSIQ